MFSAPAAHSVFCDSREALHAAIGNTIDAGTRILTNSPALLADPPAGSICISLADRTTPEAVLQLLADLPDICHVTYQRIGELSGDPLLGVIAARQVRNLYYVLYHALQLEAADLEEPRTVIQIRGTDEQRLNSPWSDLLSGNPELTVKNIAIKDLPRRDMITEKSPPLLKRLLLKSNGDWEYKFWSAVWSVLPRSISRGVCVAPDSNPLLRECAAAMGRRGFAIARMQPQGSTEVHNYPDNLKQKIISESQAVIEQALALKILPSLVAPVIGRLGNMLNQALDDFSSSRNAWRCMIEASPDKLRAMLVNTLVEPRQIGQYAAARDHDVPVIAVQHGHGREYMDAQEINEVAEEHLTSDLVITYTDEYARLTRESYFYPKPAVAVGIPEDYLRGRRKSLTRATQGEVAYISTAIFGNHYLFPLGATWSDRAKADFERTIIRDVLGELPHQCLYKPYITQLYLDDVGLQNVVEQTANVHYDTRWLTLSYILSEPRLLITSRATSTLGWCLASRKPLVFINFSNHYPLKAKVKPLFERGIFVFDYETPDFFGRLRRFMSRPLEEIEAEWRDKAADRRELEERLLGDRGLYAGKRAATAVAKFLSQRAER